MYVEGGPGQMPFASLVPSGQVWMAPSCPTLTLLDFTVEGGSPHWGDTASPQGPSH